MSVFRFKQFSVLNEESAMKVNTDGVLLGAAATIPPQTKTVLDIGTGTGTIALMLAQRLCPAPASIVGIDIDEPSAREAALNFASSPWKDNLESRYCPLQDYLPEGKIDLIVSNPPYYDESILNPGARVASARHSITLSYREIVAFAAEHLSAGGVLALVLPSSEEKRLLKAAVLSDLHLTRLIRISTTARKAPSRIIAEFSLAEKPLYEESLIIGSDAYKDITGDFYL